MASPDSMSESPLILKCGEKTSLSLGVLTNTQNSGFGSSPLLNTNPMSDTTPRYVYKIGNNFPSGLNDDDALPPSDLDKVRCIIAGPAGIGTDYAID